MKNANTPSARLALTTALCLAACDGSTRTQGADSAMSRFILEALTTKSQQENGPTMIAGNRALVRFAYSHEVPTELRLALEKAPQLLAGSPLELHSCVFQDGGATAFGPDCSDEETTISVFVARTADDFRALASHVATGSSEARSDAELAIDAVELAITAGADLQKKGPPVCVHARQPGNQRMIVRGSITVLSLEEEALQKCLLSSLYRIVGVEPYPEEAPSRTVEYLTTQTLGENPATALRFLYETRPTTRNLDKLRQDIEHWVSVENAP